jgi:hypothetical protein
MDRHRPAATDTLDAVRQVDDWARNCATELVLAASDGETPAAR